MFRSQTRTDRRGVKCQLDRVADVPARACRKVANRGISNDEFGPEWIVADTSIIPLKRGLTGASVIDLVQPAIS
jgi:hypothetical protein